MCKRLPAALAAIWLMIAMAGAAPAADKRVAITQIVEHPSLDAVRRGVIDELQAAGFTAGENLRVDYQSAQGNPATAAQIARQFVGAGPDVIVAISTPSAQAVAAATRDIPIVFSAVSDPVGARLIKDMTHPGGNLTGTSDQAPLVEQLQLIHAITPAVKTLGVIYNPGEVNSASLLAQLKQLAPAQGFTLVEAAAPRSSDVLSAARALAGKADAIYTPLDNTVVSALEAVIKVGGEAQKPVYSADVDSVERGALAAIGFDYYDVGRQTGRQAARVLQGEKPGDMPVELTPASKLVINLKAARAMGVTVPAGVTTRAARVIE